MTTPPYSHYTTTLSLLWIGREKKEHWIHSAVKWFRTEFTCRLDHQNSATVQEKPAVKQLENENWITLNQYWATYFTYLTWFECDESNISIYG